MCVCGAVRFGAVLFGFVLGLVTTFGCCLSLCTLYLSARKFFGWIRCQHKTSSACSIHIWLTKCTHKHIYYICVVQADNMIHVENLKCKLGQPKIYGKSDVRFTWTILVLSLLQCVRACVCVCVCRNASEQCFLCENCYECM